jgi:uncharacterized membrane protein YeaQ/YmgE (transglycosylase-associated protein family)
MGLIAWLILGLIAGLIASKLFNKHGESATMDIVLGIVAAIVGGLIANAFGSHGFIGFGLFSTLVSIGSAAIVLAAYHAALRQGPV